MRHAIYLILRQSTVLLFFTLAAQAHAQALSIDKTELAPLDMPTRQTLLEADEDFTAAVNGKPPIHATVDAKALPAHPNDVSYNGYGYKLLVEEIPVKLVGTVDGVLYGPILTFDEKTLAGAGNDLTSIRFYSNAEFHMLKGIK